MRVRRGLIRRLNATQKAIKRVEVALEEASNWQKARHTADLFKSVYHTLKEGATECVAFDWEKEMEPVKITIDSRYSLSTFLKRLYTKAEKMRRGAVPLQNQLDRLKTQYTLLLQALEQVDSKKTEEDTTELDSYNPLLLLSRPQKKSQAAQNIFQEPYRRFLSSQGKEIWVGKDATSNHHLTFQFSRKNDIWLHVAHHSGSHVVIPLRNQVVDEVTLHEAALLAAYFSKLRSCGGKIEIHYTQRADIYRLKNMAKGQVALRRYKSYFLEIAKGEIQALLNRKIV